jgi:DNA-binding CsgD family transcriptional regulator/tetratricopeptide (TPR) repeat protein
MEATRLPPAGPLRARAFLDAIEETDDVLGILHLFVEALDQPDLTPDLRAEIHLFRAQFESAALGRIDDAIASFDAAANARPSPGLLGCARAGAAYYRFRAGEPLDLPAFDRAVALSQQATDSRIRAFPRELRALAIGTLDLARACELLEVEVREAEEIGDELEFVEMAHHLAVMQLHKGELAAARDQLERVETPARRPDLIARHLALRAALAAALGNVAAAREHASSAEPALSEAGDVVGVTHLRMAMATLELSLGDPEAAWRTLERLAQTTDAHRHFVLVRVFPYAVEALVELGQLEQAAALAEGLEGAESILVRWRGPALRARALAQAPTDRDRTLALFDAALAADEKLGSEFEGARTLFARGRVLRRWRRRRAARESLEAALAGFEAMGARLWADRVATDLERTTARRAVDGELTRSDAQIARLAASGRTNREIAQTLFVSTKTVEAALSRVYGTLGVRSRAELAALRTPL